MKVVVWGVGIKGKRLYHILPKHSIIAYIDTNSEYRGKCFQGIPIITFEEYLEKYQDILIIVSPHKSNGILQELNKQNVSKYFLLSDEPSDMHSLNQYDLEMLFEKVFVKKKKYLVQFSNFFSLVLFEFLMKNNYTAKLIVEKNYEDVNHFLIQYRQRELVITYEENIEEYEAILIGDKSYTTIKKELASQIECIDARYCSTKIPDLYNINLSQFKNTHLNEKCFIVANGPSLRMEDLERLREKQQVTFGVNGIFKSASQTKWRPTYYVVGDITVGNYQYQEYLEYISKEKFILDAANRLWEDVVPNNIHKFQCLLDVNEGGLDIIEDITHGMVIGMTVIHACIQFAIYMGFKEIYLIGADTTSYTKNGKNHFIKNYVDGEAEKVLREPYLEVNKIIQGYESLNEYAKRKNVKIYNSTRGGELEVFERVNFDDIM